MVDKEHSSLILMYHSILYRFFIFNTFTLFEDVIIFIGKDIHIKVEGIIWVAIGYNLIFLGRCSIFDTINSLLVGTDGGSFVYP